MSDLPTQFISFYSDSLLLLIALDDVSKDVFLALCKHASFKGWCHPGDDLLSRLSCHRRDAIVGVLARLQAANYIHVVETPTPYREQPDRDIQISPYIIRLRPEFQPVALEAWERFNSQTKTHYENQIVTITYGESDRQPDQIQNQIQNQIQKQLQQPDFQSQSAVRDQSKKPFNGEEQKTGQGLKLEQGEAQRTESPSDARAIPSSAAPRPVEPKNLIRFRHPLPDETAENMALEMVNLAGDLSRENARMLVDTYGWERAERVAMLYRMKHMSVQRPGRWMRSMLRKRDEELWKGQNFG